MQTRERFSLYSVGDVQSWEGRQAIFPQSLFPSLLPSFPSSGDREESLQLPHSMLWMERKCPPKASHGLRTRLSWLLCRCFKSFKTENHETIGFHIPYTAVD